MAFGTGSTVTASDAKASDASETAPPPPKTENRHDVVRVEPELLARRRGTHHRDIVVGPETKRGSDVRW